MLAAGLVALFVIGCGLDLALNEGRLLAALGDAGQIEAACLPQLKRELAAHGFSPGDIVFDVRAGVRLPLWPRQPFEFTFSFEDGPEATRIDGVMACVVLHDDVTVDFRTARRPIRAA